MADEKIVKYIKDQLKLGFSEEVIKEQLVKAGYTSSDISEGFSKATAPEPVKALPAAPLKEMPAKATAPDAAPMATAGTGFLKKYWMIVVAVAIVAAIGIIFAVFYLGPGKGAGLSFSFGGGVKDCGSDQNCLAAAFKECSPAAGVYETSSPESTLAFNGTIAGKSGSNCKIFVDVRSATGASSGFAGKTMSCAVPQNAMAAINNPIAELSKLKPFCSGSLASALD